MSVATSIGSRIRERRIQNGLRQSDLAKAVGISPAYLNLIEHNRRRIGGKLLIDLAEKLEADTVLLSEGVQGVIIAALQQAGMQNEATQAVPAEIDRVDEFAGRFPGWAELVAGQQREISNLRHAVEVLNDRLSHDPFLSTALHEMISTVSSIRSSSSILVESKQIEPEWRDRFQRNIHEDSARLVEASQALVAYLDQDVETSSGQATPQEEFARFLEQVDFAVEEPSAESASALQTNASRSMAEDFERQVIADRSALPEDVLLEALDKTDDPAEIALIVQAPLPVVFRRLAFRKSQPGETPYGYVSADASGSLLLKKPINGFQLPNLGGACPLWPIFAAFSQPMTPTRSQIAQFGRSQIALDAFAVAEPEGGARFGQPPRFVSHMLLRPATTANPRQVGVNCRICPAKDCAARRELSILSDGF